MLYSEEILALLYDELVIMSWPDYIQNIFFSFICLGFE